MPGETELSALLRDLKPSLSEPTYVFCTAPEGRYGDFSQARPLASVQEPEGLTLVLTVADAEAAGLPYEGTYRCVTLNVYSSLEAVGLTGVVATLLARHGISANMIAGFHHDHILVPAEAAENAVRLLRGPVRI